MEVGGWKPHLFDVYRGWHNRGSTGVIVIHIGEEEHNGSFSVGNRLVTIHYNDGYETKVIQVPKEMCRFAKHFSSSRRTRHYHVWLDKNTVAKAQNATENNVNTNKNGNNMIGSEKKLPDYISPKESAGFWARVFHTRDPDFWKETLQKELDTRWNIFDTNLENLSKGWKEFKKTQMEITESYDNATNYREEWKESLVSLGNLINKMKGHEEKMWDVTQSTRQNRNMKIKQKFIRAGVDEMNFNSMTDYIEKYPELQSSRVIEKAVDKADEKRKEVIEAEKSYNQKMKEVNTYLNTVKSDLQRIEHQLDSFETIKTEGAKKIKEEQNKPAFKIRSALMTAAEKESLNLFLYECDRKINESRDQLKLMKEDLKGYEKREFRPIVTRKFVAIED